MAYNNIFNIRFHSRNEKPIHLDKGRREKGFLEAVEINSYIILIVIIIGSLIFKSLNIVAGTLIGGILSIINFKGLKWAIENIVRGKKVMFYGILLAIKFLLLTFIIFFNIIYININYISFVIGLSVIFIAIVMQTVIFYLKEDNV